MPTYGAPATADEQAAERVLVKRGWPRAPVSALFGFPFDDPPSARSAQERAALARGRAAYRRGGRPTLDEKAMLRVLASDGWSRGDAEALLGIIRLGPAAAASGPRAQDGGGDGPRVHPGAFPTWEQWHQEFGSADAPTRELTILPDGRVFVALTAEESAVADGPHPGSAVAGTDSWGRFGSPDSYGLPLPILAVREFTGTFFTVPADEEFASIVAAADNGDPTAQQVLAYLFSDRDAAVVPFDQVEA